MDHELPDPLPEFAARLRAMRKERGYSQESLAHAAGLDRTYVNSAEAGRRNVTLRTIYRLAEALDVDPAELVSDRCSLRPDDAPASVR